MLIFKGKNNVTIITFISIDGIRKYVVNAHPETFYKQSIIKSMFCRITLRYII